ncbi:MAG: pyridoxal phosphate-dependent aminotransferase [Pirellulales bacterium]
MSLEVKALKFLIWSGLAPRVDMVRRRAGENVPWLKYYSDSVLSGPGENMRLLRQILATRAKDAHLSTIDLTFGAPEFHTEWADGFAELADEAFDDMLYGDEADALTKYPPPMGHPELKRLLSQKMEAEHDVHYDAAREILIANGASHVLSLALSTLVNSGDKVVLLDPSYYMYNYMCKLLQARAAWVPTTLQDGYVQLDERRLRRAMRGAKVMIVNSPSNPTGCTIPSKVLELIVRLANEHDVLLISDEVYEYFVYAGKFQSLATVPGARNRTLVVNSFSKSYRMPAYRVGYVYGPEPLLQAMTMQQVIQVPFTSTLNQRFAVRALERQSNIQERANREFLPKREVVLTALREAGLEIPPPTGAFYAWVPIRALKMTAHDFAFRLASEQGVLVMPGDDFGRSGRGHIRLSFGGPIDELRDGMSRIVDFVDHCRHGKQNVLAAS